MSGEEFQGSGERDKPREEKGKPVEVPARRRRGLWRRVKPVVTGLAVAGAMTLGYGAGVFQERWESYARQESLRSSYERRVSRLESKNDSLESSLEGLVSGAGRGVESEPLSTVEYYPERKPPEAIDSLSLPLGSYMLEVDKNSQRARVWQRARYRLVADVPCSTGANPGEKERSGDSKTPGGYALIVSEQNSSAWTYDGEFAYGEKFLRFNYGSWSASGSYNPSGHCSLGAHGTNEEHLLGSRQSHGCTRLPNEFLGEATSRDWLAPGVPLYVVPESLESLRSSASGAGYHRIEEALDRKDSGN